MQGDLFRIELRSILDMSHPLVKLSAVVDWAVLDAEFTPLFCDDNGRPATSVRLIVSLHYLKYTFDLSDDAVLDGWVENPYWQHLSGMKFFEHKRPIDSSSMTRFRKRIGEAGAEVMLRETIKAGLAMKAVRPHQLDRVNVDTTVQEKHVRFPTDARLYDRARERLVKAAAERGIALRQNYNRVGKRLFLKSNRYAHARQMKRARRCRRKLKTILGRVIRDIERKCPSPDVDLQALLDTAHRIHAQQRHDKNKIYSVHEPHIECIAKGKAHKKYEFGVKVSVAATSRGGWFVGALAAPGNPYDGHTLAQAIEQIARIAPRPPKNIFVDRGYRGHDYDGPAQVHVDKQRRGRTAARLWKWMKRRAAIEPGISHLKHGHRMDRNRLKGLEGDQINAVMSAAGMNFSKLLAHAALFYFFLRHLIRLAGKKAKIKPFTHSYPDTSAA
jgi:IS5 family transposase